MPENMSSIRNKEFSEIYIFIALICLKTKTN